MPNRSKQKATSSKIRTLTYQIALQRHQLFMSLIKISFTVLLIVVMASVGMTLWLAFKHSATATGTETMPLISTFVEVFKIAVSLK